MNFGWLQSLLLGITTGLTDVLPVSAQAHEQILVKFMGRGAVPALMQLFMHLGVIAAVFLSCQPHILKMVRAKKCPGSPREKESARWIPGALWTFGC